MPRRPIALAVLGLAALTVIAAWWWSQSNGVLGGDVVDVAGVPSPAGERQPQPLASGQFRGFDRHRTTGTAVVDVLEDGTRELRLEDFETTEGPDLLVWLSAAPPDSEGLVYTDDHVNLGPLESTSGTQSYEIPPEVDLDRYRSVVIWSRQLAVPFGVAPISR